MKIEKKNPVTMTWRKHSLLFGASGDGEEQALAFALIQGLAVPCEGEGPALTPATVAAVAQLLVQALSSGPSHASLCTRATAALCNLVAAFPSAAWLVRV